MRDRLCFSTLGCTEYAMPEIVALCRRFDIHALEVRGAGGVMRSEKIAAFSDAEAGETRALWRTAGIRPAVLGTSCAFYRQDTWEQALAEGREALTVCRRMGFEAIRVFGDKLCPGEDAAVTVDRICRGLEALCREAEGTAVKILLEVHGDFNRTETMGPVLERCGGLPAFGLIWDIAHSDTAYGDDWQPFYRMIRPYVRHVHVKDHFRAGEGVPMRLTPVGEGQIPIAAIVRTLEADGYRGLYSLEWEKKWHPALCELPIALEGFVSYMEGLK